VLLAHPPNSSSAVTLGAGLKPPLAPGTMAVLAKEELEFPHPKSAAGDLGCWEALCTGATGTAGAGAGALHSVVPQTSAPDIAVDAKADGAAAGAAAGAAGLLCGDDRLKTELAVGEVT
jgi:hypothetical protein